MNWRKEAIDQPLHALWSGLSTWAVASGTPLVFLGLVSFTVLVLREVYQKWDPATRTIKRNLPWTDIAGYTTGILGATALLVAL